MIFLLGELKLLPLRCRLFEPASLRVCLKIILPIFLLLRSRISGSISESRVKRPPVPVGAGILPLFFRSFPWGGEVPGYVPKKSPRR